MTTAAITAIDYYLPAGEVSNQDLSREFPDWSVKKIADKTGIDIRHVSAAGECSSDLAAAAAERLFASGIDRSSIDYVLFCTQTPDYFLPTTACLLQARLGIPTSAGAVDFNLGCSGYIYGLGFAKGLIETGQARKVLLLTGETYSKLLATDDRSVRTVFGDAGSATLVEAASSATNALGPFVYGSDGAGARNLIVEHGAFRKPMSEAGAPAKPTLAMDGAEIFAFTLNTIPAAVDALLGRADLSPDAVDLYVFHQANRHMLDHLRRKCAIPEGKFLLHMADCGNTVSATIPIALCEAARAGRLKPGAIAVLVGFGVGYSWGATVCRWVGIPAS
ncbi:MAG TPA: ketoacyl-ACP synthase III [Vicinamibacterales bacterium]|nr:ketoacyl-ACP synthase III [Vicinamibacterales bacterium]